MKRFRKTINLALSAVIVALGFGACASQKSVKEAERPAEELQEQKQQKEQTDKNQGKAEEYQQKMEERKVVYGPRPTGYNPNISK